MSPRGSGHYHRTQRPQQAQILARTDRSVAMPDRARRQPGGWKARVRAPTVNGPPPVRCARAAVPSASGPGSGGPGRAGRSIGRDRGFRSRCWCPTRATARPRSARRPGVRSRGPTPTIAGGPASTRRHAGGAASGQADRIAAPADRSGLSCASRDAARRPSPQVISTVAPRDAMWSGRPETRPNAVMASSGSSNRGRAASAGIIGLDHRGQGRTMRLAIRCDDASSLACRATRTPSGSPVSSLVMQTVTPRSKGQRSASGRAPAARAARSSLARNGAAPARSGSTRSTRSARAKAASHVAPSGSAANVRAAAVRSAGTQSSHVGSIVPAAGGAPRNGRSRPG